MKRDYRIYMDCCCINRPYDDTNDLLVSLEGQAITTIAFKCFYGLWILVGSEAIKYEITKTQDEYKKDRMLNLYSIIKENILINKSITQKMYFYINTGIKPMDSLHLACAEYGNVDILLTTDKSFLNKSKTIKMSIRVENPVAWLMEVNNYGN
jgi:predicted nucleic acid-binding protein